MGKAFRVRSGVRNSASSRGFSGRTLVLALTSLLMTCGSEPQPATTTPPVAWTKPVPKATCGANDRVEPGLQGQTSLADRTSGASETAYNCNLELVGQAQGEGSSGSSPGSTTARTTGRTTTRSRRIWARW